MKQEVLKCYRNETGVEINRENDEEMHGMDHWQFFRLSKMSKTTYQITKKKRN